MTEAVGGAYVTNGRQQALAFHDYLTRFVLPLCEAAADRASLSTTLTMSAVYLVDIHSFSLRQAWSLKNYAQDVSQLLATCYPETIERVYVCIPLLVKIIFCKDFIVLASLPTVLINPFLGLERIDVLRKDLELLEQVDRPSHSVKASDSATGRSITNTLIYNQRGRRTGAIRRQLQVSAWSKPASG